MACHVRGARTVPRKSEICRIATGRIFLGRPLHQHLNSEPCVSVPIHAQPNFYRPDTNQLCHRSIEAPSISSIAVIAPRPSPNQNHQQLAKATGRTVLFM